MDPATSSRPSGAWAPLWLGGAAMAVWIPLLLADFLPLATTAASPSSLVATRLVQASAPSVLAQPAPRGAQPRPKPARERRAVSALVHLLPPQRVKTAKAKVLARPAAAPSPDRQKPLSGSLLLGGPLTLASLHEKPMVPAARIEQVLRTRSADRLAAVPLHWRPSMEALVQGQQRVLTAEVVRLPAPHLKKPEEYPMTLQSDGVAETPVTPSAASRLVLNRWAERQSPTPQGSVRPVLVVLEPLAAEPRSNGRGVTYRPILKRFP